MSEYGWDDSDEDVDDQPPVSKSGKKGKGTTQPSVKDYMDMMDRELATDYISSCISNYHTIMTTTAPTIII
jgi:hypothetical protein